MLWIGRRRCQSAPSRGCWRGRPKRTRQREVGEGGCAAARRQARGEQEPAWRSAEEERATKEQRRRPAWWATWGAEQGRRRRRRLQLRRPSRGGSRASVGVCARRQLHHRQGRAREERKARQEEEEEGGRKAREEREAKEPMRVTSASERARRGFDHHSQKHRGFASSRRNTNHTTAEESQPNLRVEKAPCLGGRKFKTEADRGLPSPDTRALLALCDLPSALGQYLSPCVLCPSAVSVPPPPSPPPPPLVVSLALCSRNTNVVVVHTTPRRSVFRVSRRLLCCCSSPSHAVRCMGACAPLQFVCRC